MDRRSENLRCFLAESGLWLTPVGGIQTCCSIKYLPQDIIQQQDGFQPHDLKSWFYSDFNRKLRDDLAKGIQRPECHVCWHKESLGLSSERTAKTLSSDPIPRLRMLELAAGKTCNLRCRMCDPGSSSAIEQELRHHDVAITDVGRPIDLSLVNVEDLRDVKSIKMTGGEPFLNKPAAAMLVKLAESGIADEIDINIFTNCTVWPSDDWLSALRSFKSVRIIFSIDGAGSVHEFIRDGLVWSDMVSVQQKWGQWRVSSGLDNIRFHIHTTVMILNVLYMDRLMRYIGSLRRGMPGFSDLSWFPDYLRFPRHLSVFDFPHHVKDRIADVVLTWTPSDLADWLAMDDASAQQAWMNIRLAFDGRHIVNDAHMTLQQFTKSQDLLDLWRGQDIRSTLPELMQIIDRYTHAGIA